ncbi:alpha/beta hydrolase [Actinomadura kijaniata]|uniref:alpha/beta hydrolase n=1 Tax=Actinomadura kijaniata TaxID=46161 RepID=UPI003F1DBA32
MRAVKITGAVLTACALAACTDSAVPQTAPTGTPPGLDRFYGQKAAWKDCDGDFQCATVEVPLDYARPGGETIRISMVRLPASDRSGRVGSLFTNPGGPGASGVEFVRKTARAFSPELLRRFDIVGFDPRGVGASAPVRCLDGPGLDRFFSTDSSPDDQRETDALANESRAFAESCRTGSAARLPHVGTLNAARDMDILRAATGDRKMTYYGASYGTYLGAYYADQFPKNVRALVLDGAVDPKQTATGLLVEQAKGFETALRSFAEDCVKTSACPLGATADAAVDRVSALLRQADERPLTNRRDSRKVTESWVVMGIATALYNKESWPFLRQALSQAVGQGDGTQLITIADLMVERRPDGTYSNQVAANMSVNCVDKPNPPDARTYGESVAEARRSAPRFGPFVVWGGLPCVYWPAKPEAEPKPPTATGAAPILVIGTLRDPATPYAWSEALARQLDSGVLLTFNGDGHTAYLQGDRCVTQATDRYLTTAEPPPNGTRCG